MSVLGVERWQSSASRSSVYTDGQWCSTDMCVFLQVWACVFLNVSHVYQTETGLERVWDITYFCVGKAARWDEERKLVPLSGKLDPVIPLCHAGCLHMSLECHRGCRMTPPRTHVSHLVSDTDYPLLQCGGCQHRIRHRYWQTNGQVELHKSILDTNSCKYLPLCFFIKVI